MNERYGPQNSTYNLRPRRPRDFAHLHATLEQVAMTQYSLKKGLKEFGIPGVEAVWSESQQLHDRNVLSPVSITELSHIERKDALPYLMFLKQKRSGQIKGRGCADGRKQRSYKIKEKVSSPTVSIESVMLTSVIDAMEHRNVATVDIPGSFMQAEMDEIVYMRLDGRMAELLVQIDPKISLVFGKEAPLTITRGHVHEYLGMTLDFSCNGKVIIRMEQFIKDTLDESAEDMEGMATTPATNHLFEVKNPDKDDYKKLARVIKYLRATQSLGLTLESNNTNVIKWWVDASYGTHHDMRSHTGGVMTLGNGAIYSTSTQQKLNTRSSTEGELVAVHDVMPQIIWTQYFLEAQGIKVKENILYQDNKSAMLLETNGRGSSSKRTRHINVKYFFVKDRIGNDDISLAHCPAEGMIADFFTKPLQGKQFEMFRDVIMNATVAQTAPHDQAHEVHRSVLDELVTGSISDVNGKQRTVNETLMYHPTD